METISSTAPASPVAELTKTANPVIMEHVHYVSVASTSMGSTINATNVVSPCMAVSCAPTQPLAYTVQSATTSPTLQTMKTPASLVL
jgi:hypothetical protein